MASESIDRLQGKLRQRLERIQDCDPIQLRFVLAQVYTFLQSEPIIKSILDTLRSRKSNPFNLGSTDNTDFLQQTFQTVVKTEEDNAAFAYGNWWGLQNHRYGNLSQVEAVFHTTPITDGDPDLADYNSATRFKRHIIAPVFDYITEQLDTQQLLFYQLLRYKTRCEVFDYDSILREINTLLADETKEQKRLEKVLQTDLYRYLHDEGIDFAIEPKLIEDMVDILASLQNDPQPKLIETKIFRKRKRAPIRDGYNQLLEYVRRYNANVGYLVVYNLTSSRLELDLDTKQVAFRSLTEAGNTVHFLVIDVPLDRVAAAKQGDKDSFVINRGHLLNIAGDADEES